MIIWQGFGIMVFILPILFIMLLGEKLSSLACIISGIILFFWGKHLHKPEENNTILYDNDGKSYAFQKHTDTFFYIPMEYCGIIMGIIATIYFLKEI